MTRGPVRLTFAEFQATRRDGVLRDLLGPRGDEPAVRGCVYVATLHLIEANHPQGKYELVIGNGNWLSDDRAALERRLYEFALAEGYVRDPEAMDEEQDPWGTEEHD